MIHTKYRLSNLVYIITSKYNFQIQLITTTIMAEESNPEAASASAPAPAPAPQTPAALTAAMPSYSTDPALYVYTSLTAGSSHIVTATSRLETILRANRVPFKAVDLSVDDKARMLWGRRAGKDHNGRLRKLPGLVQMGMVVGVS